MVTVGLAAAVDGRGWRLKSEPWRLAGRPAWRLAGRATTRGRWRLGSHHPFAQVAPVAGGVAQPSAAGRADEVKRARDVERFVAAAGRRMLGGTHVRWIGNNVPSPEEIAAAMKRHPLPSGRGGRAEVRPYRP